MRTYLRAALLAITILLSSASVTSLHSASACTVSDLPRRVLLETTEGDILLELFDDTPLHRDNFLRLVSSGYYDGLLFHRVIPEFVVQAGDSASRHAAPGTLLGESPDSVTIAPEFRFPTHFHRRGALGMAREGDDVNPQQLSCSTQFYIVNGRYFTDDALDRMQQRLDSVTQGRIHLPDSVRQVYRTEGGAPHLDGQYTVFGQVIDGYDVLDAIQFRERDANNRPLSDVRIIRATVVKPE